MHQTEENVGSAGATNWPVVVGWALTSGLRGPALPSLSSALRCMAHTPRVRRATLGNGLPSLVGMLWVSVLKPSIGHPALDIEQFQFPAVSSQAASRL